MKGRPLTGSGRPPNMLLRAGLPMSPLSAPAKTTSHLRYLAFGGRRKSGCPRSVHTEWSKGAFGGSCVFDAHSLGSSAVKETAGATCLWGTWWRTFSPTAACCYSGGARTQPTGRTQQPQTVPQLFSESGHAGAEASSSAAGGTGATPSSSAPASTWHRAAGTFC